LILDDAKCVEELERQLALVTEQRDAFRKLWREASADLQAARQRIWTVENGALPNSLGDELLEFVRSKIRANV
jgi:hypothetical protein